MYRIVNWNVHFENNRTRELKQLAWVPFPNRHDGDGYTELLDHQDGAAHYGVWCAIVQVASKCDPRGTLLRDGARPHDAASLSRMIRVPAEVVSEALDRLVDPIKWIEVIPDPVAGQAVTEIPHLPATAPHFNATAPQEGASNGTEWNRMEKKGITPVDRNRSGQSDQSTIDAREGEKADLSDLDWERVTGFAEAIGRKIPPRTPKDRRAWLRFAVLAETAFSEAWLTGAAEAVVHAKETKKTKIAHFVGMLRRRANEEYGIDKETFVAMLRRIEIPASVWKSGVLEIRA